MKIKLKKKDESDVIRQLTAYLAHEKTKNLRTVQSIADELHVPVLTLYRWTSGMHRPSRVAKAMLHYFFKCKRLTAGE